MTIHVVADEQLGKVERRNWEVKRRLMEGTLCPDFVARNLQVIAEGNDVVVPSNPPTITSPFFADEEETSNFGYPKEYAHKQICEQLVELSRYFPNLNSGPVLVCSRELPTLPAGAKGWFVIPKWERVGDSYNEAVETVLGKIADSRSFCNYRKGELGPKHLRLSERTKFALKVLGEQHEGDYLLVPGQFGLRHAGRSVRRARVLYDPNEFGFGSFMAATALLAHPERLIRWEQLHMDCPGDEYSPDSASRFDGAPGFGFNGGRVEFSAYWVCCADAGCGSASGFLPQ